MGEHYVGITAEVEFLYCHFDCERDSSNQGWPCYKQASSLLFLRLGHEIYGNNDYLVRCNTGGG